MYVLTLTFALMTAFTLPAFANTTVNLNETITINGTGGTSATVSAAFTVTDFDFQIGVSRYTIDQLQTQINAVGTASYVISGGKFDVSGSAVVNVSATNSIQSEPGGRQP